MNNELQARFDALETEKASLNPSNPDDKFRLTVIEQEQAQIRTQLDEQDRLQKQAVEVAEVELPHDYDALWRSGANEEIRSLLRQAKEQIFARHNDELATLVEAHREQLAAALAEITSLNTEMQQLQADLDIANQNYRQAIKISESIEERLEEVAANRDNAVRAKEEAEVERDRALTQAKSLSSQVDELEGMLRTLRSQANGGYTGALKLTSTLKPDTKADELNRILERRGLDPLPLPVRPEEPVTQEQIAEQSAAVEEAAAEAERFPEVVQVDTAGSEPSTGAEEAAGDAGPVRPAASLESRVAALEAWKAQQEQMGADFVQQFEERLNGMHFER